MIPMSKEYLTKGFLRELREIPGWFWFYCLTIEVLNLLIIIAAKSIVIALRER
jgi:hypothetical protein